MTGTKDLTEKQKFFEKRYERSGEYLRGVTNKEICDILDDVLITKKEIEDLLEDLKFDKVLYDELEDTLYNEESEYCIDNLNDNDIIKRQKKSQD